MRPRSTRSSTAVATVAAHGVSGVVALRRWWRRRRRRLRGSHRVRRESHRSRRCSRRGCANGVGPAGLDKPVTAPAAATDAELIDLVTGELGSDWPRLVAPAFDSKRRFCSTIAGRVPADLVKLWLAEEDDIDADWVRLSERFEGAGHAVATQANWWQGKALAAGRVIHASLFGRIAAGAESPERVVTATKSPSSWVLRRGRSRRRWRLSCSKAGPLSSRRRPSSVAIAWLSTRGCIATMPVMTRLCGSCRPTWRHTPTSIRWHPGSVASRPKASGRNRSHQDAQTPTLLFPFAAPRVSGDLSEAGSRSRWR